MSLNIKTINLGGVNCYLLTTGSGYILIDTGFSSKRAHLDKELASAGVRPGNLSLILLTHGDSDHADNSAYLREKFGAPIAMHKDDSGMVKTGDMSWNRKSKPDKLSMPFRIMMKLFSGMNKPGSFNTFTPDFYVADGQSLTEYGLEAVVLHLPGHSKGSIGILTASGELFCGDMFYNFAGFQYIDDMADYTGSIEKLKKMQITMVYPGQKMQITMVYPGHGKAFRMRL